MSLRLFVAVTLSDDIAALLVALQKSVPGAKWQPGENLHLTLRFFGEVTEPVAHEIDVELAGLAGAVSPFALQLKGAGFFGGAAPRALWIGAANSPALSRLAALCERTARRVGLKPESRKFAPHVTLAYLGGAEIERVHAFEARHSLFEAPPFQVEAVSLYSSWTRKSASSLYRLEAEYSLAR